LSEVAILIGNLCEKEDETMAKYEARMNQVNVPEMTALIQEDVHSVIALAETEYQKKVAGVCDLILSQNRRIILLTGPSSSGKTTTAKLIQAELEQRGKKIYRISLDNFYRPHDELPRWNDGYVNYESIDGLDLPYFHQLVSTLKEEGHAEFPIFDFSLSERSKKTFPVSFDEETYVIFEGIHALNPMLTKPFDGHPVIRIYVSVHSDFVDSDGTVLLKARELRLLRRMLRDNVHRNADPVKTLELWEYVARGEEQYIKPFRSHADVHINSTHAYEPFVYRDDAVEELSDYVAHPKYGPIIQDLLKKISDFQPVSKQLVPKRSLLKEFI
jgi:uridine kinase